MFRDSKIFSIILACLILNSCISLERSFQNSQEIAVKNVNATDLEQIENNVQMSNYDKAEKILARISVQAVNENSRYKFLATIVYDQLSQPEKAILNAQEFLNNSKSKKDNYIAKSLLLKNYYKVQNKQGVENLKNEISKITTAEVYDGNELLSSLRISLNFNCQIYCLEEIKFLQEIQIQIFYIIERDSEVVERARDLLLSRYDFFLEFLKNDQLDIKFRKNISYLLYESLQKAKSLHLEDNTSGSVYTAGLEVKFNNYQNKVEQWIYDHQ